MSVRINQRLEETPRPEDLAVPIPGERGPAGPGPTHSQLVAAVSAYFALLNSGGDTDTHTAAHNRFGEGAEGFSGVFVDLGDFDTSSGHISAGGSPASVDLHISAQSGDVHIDSPLYAGGVRLDSGVLEHVQSTPSASWDMVVSPDRLITSVTLLVADELVLTDVSYAGSSASATFPSAVAGRAYLTHIGA